MSPMGSHFRGRGTTVPRLAASASASGPPLGDALPAIVIGGALAISSLPAPDLTGEVEAVSGADRSTVGIDEDVHERKHEDCAADGDIDIQPSSEWHRHE